MRRYTELGRATKFEFEQRFWIIGAIFWLGFSPWLFGRGNFAVSLLRLAAPSVDPDSAAGTGYLRLIFGAGSLFVFGAALLRTWATAYLRVEVVHDMSQHSEALVADGPYRYLRNPLYFANVPMAAGMAVLASPLGWLFIVAANWIFVYRLILREEEGLRESQGDSYRRYCEAVPRFWPSFTPRLPAGGGQPRWGQAIAGEMFIWILGLAVLCFAITLSLKIAAVLLVSAFVFYFVAVAVVKKRAAASGD